MLAGVDTLAKSTANLPTFEVSNSKGAKLSELGNLCTQRVRVTI